VEVRLSDGDRIMVGVCLYLHRRFKKAGWL